jgi:hypothetical protein
MKSMLIRLLPICSVLLWSIDSFAQEANRKKILGTWAFSKIEFLRSNEDSLNLINNAKGMIVIFSEDKVTVKNKFDSTITRTSGYTISADGSTLTHNGATATIAKLTDEELVLNIATEGVIERFKKVH